MRGRTLTPVELVSYDLISFDLTEEVRVHRIPSLPGPFVGITLGRRIFLAVDVAPDGTSRLLAHELIHVEQWHRLGLVRFLASYITSYAKGLIRTRSVFDAYRAIPLEFEAQQRAERWERRR